MPYVPSQCAVILSLPPPTDSSFPYSSTLHSHSAARRAESTNVRSSLSGLPFAVLVKFIWRTATQSRTHDVSTGKLPDYSSYCSTTIDIGAVNGVPSGWPCNGSEWAQAFPNERSRICLISLLCTGTRSDCALAMLFCMLFHVSWHWYLTRSVTPPHRDSSA